MLPISFARATREYVVFRTPSCKGAQYHEDGNVRHGCIGASRDASLDEDRLGVRY